MMISYLRPSHIVDRMCNTRAEEVGQAGRKASWVPVPNCARDFIDSLAVVE